ncbi:MAG: hypothetical protein AAGB10_17100 [Pseudomonadota bacterium]
MANTAEDFAGDVPSNKLGVTAPNDQTPEVPLKQPPAYVPAMTTYGTLFPAHQGA